MSVEGFDLILNDYCAYCPDFSPDIEKLDMSDCGHLHRTFTEIRCRNKIKCEAITQNLMERIKSGRFKKMTANEIKDGLMRQDKEFVCDCLASIIHQLIVHRIRFDGYEESEPLEHRMKLDFSKFHK